MSSKKARLISRMQPSSRRDDDSHASQPNQQQDEKDDSAAAAAVDTAAASNDQPPPPAAPPPVAAAAAAAKRDDGTIALGPKDAIMGRGAQATDHLGNKRLRALVRERFEEYMNTGRHKEKQRIAQEIIVAFQSEGGRFVQQVFPPLGDGVHGDTPPDTWRIVTDPKIILDKVKQTLRDKNPQTELKRKLRKRKHPESASSPSNNSKEQSLFTTDDHSNYWVPTMMMTEATRSPQQPTLPHEGTQVGVASSASHVGHVPAAAQPPTGQDKAAAAATPSPLDTLASVIVQEQERQRIANHLLAAAAAAATTRQQQVMHALSSAVAAMPAAADAQATQRNLLNQALLANLLQHNNLASLPSLLQNTAEARRPSFSIPIASIDPSSITSPSILALLEEVRRRKASMSSSGKSGDNSNNQNRFKKEE